MSSIDNASPIGSGSIPGALSPPSGRGARRAPAISTRPLVGVVAVLIGSIISTLAGRVTSFGLADVRGAVHAGFDEGAWITTALTVGQMLIAPVAIWAGGAFGARRVLS